MERYFMTTNTIGQRAGRACEDYMKKADWWLGRVLGFRLARRPLMM
jgi:hypothetical protein